MTKYEPPAPVIANPSASAPCSATKSSTTLAPRPPMPLQGVWSADAGSLPPWKGDYHNDLNTQMTYLAYRTAGNFEEGLCFLDYLWKRLPTFRQSAKDFYGAPGAAVPRVMSLAGQPLGGWGQYSLRSE